MRQNLLSMFESGVLSATTERIAEYVWALQQLHPLPNDAIPQVLEAWKTDLLDAIQKKLESGTPEASRSKWDLLLNDEKSGLHTVLEVKKGGGEEKASPEVAHVRRALWHLASLSDESIMNLLTASEQDGDVRG